MTVRYGYKVKPYGEGLHENYCGSMLDAYADVDARTRAVHSRYGVTQDAIDKWKASRYAACGCRKVGASPEFGWSIWDKSECTSH